MSILCNVIVQVCKAEDLNCNQREHFRRFKIGLVFDWPTKMLTNENVFGKMWRLFQCLNLLALLSCTGLQVNLKFSNCTIHMHHNVQDYAHCTMCVHFNRVGDVTLAGQLSTSWPGKVNRRRRFNSFWDTFSQVVSR